MMGREKRRREADILFLFPSSTARFLCFNHCYFYWNGKRELDSKKSPSCDLTCGKSKEKEREGSFYHETAVLFFWNLINRFLLTPYRSNRRLDILISQCQGTSRKTGTSFYWGDIVIWFLSDRLRQHTPGDGGGGVLGLIFAGYVPLACLAVLFVHSQVKKGNPDS